MALIDFTPGLQAIGKMFEDKGKMDLDLYQRQKELDKKNKIIGFNNLMYQNLSNVKDEKELLYKQNALMNIAQQEGIYSDVQSGLSSFAETTTKRIKINEADKVAEQMVESLRKTNTKYEYNGQITDVNDVITDIKSKGLDNRSTLAMLESLAKDEAKYTSSVTNIGGKYYINRGYSGTTTNSETESLAIVQKDGKIYDSKGNPLTAMELEKYSELVTRDKEKAHDRYMEQVRLGMQMEKNNKDSKDQTDRQILYSYQNALNAYEKQRDEYLLIPRKDEEGNFAYRDNYNKITFGTKYDKDRKKFVEDEEAVTRIFGTRNDAIGNLAGNIERFQKMGKIRINGNWHPYEKVATDYKKYLNARKGGTLEKGNLFVQLDAEKDANIIDIIENIHNASEQIISLTQKGK